MPSAKLGHAVGVTLPRRLIETLKKVIYEGQLYPD